jgi:hypothetical protein
LSHDDGIVQGLADSYIPVIGHHCQQCTLCTPNQKENNYLCHAPKKRNGFPLHQEVYQHLRDNASRETEICEREISKKKVHGGVKLRVHEDEDDDEQVSKYSHQVNGEEKNK